MPEFVVPAESRSETGKNVNRRLRSRGLIPGVVYGTGKDAVAVAVSPREIGAILKSASGENTLFDLDLGGTRRKVILKEFQREPLRGQLLHADFYEVALDKVLEVKVHVELTGTPVGVKLQGGLVDFVTRELELECLPADIPEKIVADISHLELGKHLRVSDLTLGDKVKVLDRRRPRDRARGAAACRGRGGDGGGRGGARSRGGRARGHQEGQDRQGRGRGRREGREGRQGRRRAASPRRARRRRRSSLLRFVVGLGNPGERYRRTRHNAGFMAVDVLAARARAAGRVDGDAWVAEASLAGETALLVKPLSFMNGSGGPVARVLAANGGSPADLVGPRRRRGPGARHDPRPRAREPRRAQRPALPRRVAGDRRLRPGPDRGAAGRAARRPRASTSSRTSSPTRCSSCRRRWGSRPTP